jgi:hypothetical protein
MRLFIHSEVKFIFIGKSSFLKALAGQLYVGGNKLDGTITYNGDASNCGRFKLPKVTDYIDEKDQHAPTLFVSLSGD